MLSACSETRNMEDVNCGCQVCGKRELVMKRCTRCRVAYYCSRNCQISDWTNHRNNCHLTVAAAERTSMSSCQNSKELCATDISTNLHQQDISPTEHMPNKKARIGFTKYCHNIVPGNVAMETDLVPTGIFENDQDIKKSNPDDLSACCNIVSFETKNCSRVTEYEPVAITVKCGKLKHKLNVQTFWNGDEIFTNIANISRVPAGKMKVIHKGKLQTSETIKAFIREKAVFQVIGELAEDESGIDSRDIDVLMTQLCIERNEAIKVMRKSGNLVDAMLELGNKL